MAISPKFWMRCIVGYYFATPLFFVLDFVFGWNIRVWFLDSTPLWRMVYYAFTFGCWFLMFRFPRAVNVVGLCESSVNIFLLTASFLALIFKMYSPTEVSAIVQQGGQFPLNEKIVLNYAFAVTIWLASYYQNALIAPRR